MFLNAKLRLLMTLLRFERLGQENVEGISWVVPAELKSAELRESKAAIDKALVMGITDGRDPSDLLRKKYGHEPRGVPDQTSHDVHFGSDSEGEDIVPDGPLFPPNPRSKANALEDLKKKRKKKKDKGEKEPVDEETLEERRQARLENNRSRLAKIKSDLFVHASDEESDDDADQEFFRLEEEMRKDQSERIKKALLLGRPVETGDKSKKKRGKRSNESHGAGEEAGGKRRRQSPQAGVLSEDDDIRMNDADTVSQASSVGSRSDGAIGVGKTSPAPAEDEMYLDDDLAFSRDREGENQPHPDNLTDQAPSPKDDDGADEEDEDTPQAAPGRRRMRAGFVIESDSE